MALVTGSTSNAGSTHTTFAFMDLPSELRMLVYDYLSTPVTRKLPLDNFDIFYYFTDSAILQVSKLVQREAMPTLRQPQPLTLIVRFVGEKFARANDFIKPAAWVEKLIGRLQPVREAQLGYFRVPVYSGPTSVTEQESVSLDLKRYLGSVSDAQAADTFYDYALDQLRITPVLHIRVELLQQKVTPYLWMDLKYLFWNFWIPARADDREPHIQLIFAVPLDKLAAYRALLESLASEPWVKSDFWSIEALSENLS